MRVSLTDYPTIKHYIASASIDIVQNTTGMGDDKPHALSIAYVATFIQQLINKDIEVIKLYKKDYNDVVSSSAEDLNLKEMIDEHEQWEAGRKKRKKKSSKKAKKKKK